jgi:Trypsin-co-occurring domain 2
MPQRRRLTTNMAFAVVFALVNAPAWADTSDVPLDQLLSDIQKALIKVRDASEIDALPPLSTIHLTLRATLKREADGSLKFHVLEAGAKASDESVQELHLQLEPPDAPDKSPAGASVAPLADAIIDAARSVKKAATGNPPLHLAKLEARVEFTIEKEAGFIVFVGAKANSQNIQEIVLTFGKKDCGRYSVSGPNRSDVNEAHPVSRLDGE